MAFRIFLPAGLFFDLVRDFIVENVYQVHIQMANSRLQSSRRIGPLSRHVWTTIFKVPQELDVDPGFAIVATYGKISGRSVHNRSSCCSILIGGELERSLGIVASLTN